MSSIKSKLKMLAKRQLRYANNLINVNAEIENSKSIGAIIGIAVIVVVILLIGILTINKFNDNNVNQLDKNILNNEKQVDSINKIIDEFNKDNPNNAINHINLNDENIINDYINDNSSDNAESFDYFKTLQENIVKDDETGIVYVNNELLVSLKKGISKEQLEEVLHKVGGKIVGQYSSIGEYQIQLDNNYSYTELKSVQKELEKNDIIDNIVLNIGIDIQDEFETARNCNDIF